MNNNKVVIVGATRTAIGKFGGSLKDFTPGQLGSIVIKNVLDKVPIEKDGLDEVIMGNVLSAGHGQNIARQAAMLANISEDVPSYTVNKVCGSGLKSVILGAQSIMLGDADIILAGGIESMSTCPYALKDVRWGLRMNNSEILDIMIYDGLWDIFNNYHMGITAENIAEKYGITREEQDEFAALSQNKVENAIKGEKFKDEIVPIEIARNAKREDKKEIFARDEFPRFGTTKEILAKLKPAFKETGTVTAGNSSGVNDGAACVLLMSESAAEDAGIEHIAKIESYAYSGVSPDIMGMGPVDAIKMALERADITIDGIDLIELNEAFAAQSLAVIKELNLNKDIVNVNGGAIALGHPIGASGSRILVTLLHEMMKKDYMYGLASLCIGGGQGIAMIVSR